LLSPADPYHGYYQHEIEKVVQGELEDDVEQYTKIIQPNKEMPENSNVAKCVMGDHISHEVRFQNPAFPSPES
jgi:hypothetical protein